MKETELLEHIERQLLPTPPKKMAVAVSGGGDSIALLALTAIFAKKYGIEVHAISIDHGLRKGTDQEIKLVTQLCVQIGCQHHVEHWSGWDGGGNLQDRARTARYKLIADWAAGKGISVVVLGHTADDQAETLMMRLSRGAGVDGLSAMSPRREQSGITWVRPLLGVQRRDLRHFLEAKQLTWAEDPSNENRDFERIRMRDALKLLEPLGFHANNLIAVADQMSKARAALNWQTFLAAKEIAEVSHGAISISMAAYHALPVEISRRLLVHALSWLSNSDYPPRRGAIEQARLSIGKGTAHTLHGCHLLCDGDQLWMFREFNDVKDLDVDVGNVWDDRWTVTGSEDGPEYRVCALGPDGLSQVPNWRDAQVPRAALMTTPGVFLKGDLIAAPVLKDGDRWTADLEGGANGFFDALLSH